MNLPHLTSEQMALVDHLAVSNGLSITQMMEFVGINIARYAQHWKVNPIVSSSQFHPFGGSLYFFRKKKIL